jgi:2-aminobenzoate-CoA ligase
METKTSSDSEWASAHVDTYTRDGLPPRDSWPELSFELPELAYPRQLNAAAVLVDDALGRIGDNPCVRGAEVWTYAQVAERSERIARVLVDEMDLLPGNRVLLRAPNTPEVIVAWLAVLKAGGVVVATMPLLRARELAKIIAKGKVTHALCDTRLQDELAAAQNLQPDLRHVMTMGPDGELDRRAARQPPEFAAVKTAAEDVALIAFTSGTTGEPKGCLHMHRDLLAVCDTFGRHVLDSQPNEIFTGTPPLAFTYGLGGLVLFPLRVGASTVPIEQAGPRALVRAIRDHRITTLFTAPTGYRALLAERAEVGALASLRKCVAAGEPLPAATSNSWFQRTGIRIIDGIGSTEMLHIFISAPPDRVRPGATGVPVPGYQAQVVDADMRPAAVGDVGRLAVRGPTGCRYLGDARQMEYVIDGWNLTGDSYVVDADGYFWFQGRVDDMIVSSGYNISGLEVEAALLEHPAVQECAVVASPDEERGHVVKAFVVTTEGADASEDLVEALQVHVKAQIAPYKYPRRIAFLDQLPKTQTGKIQRYKLREMESARTPTA